MLRAWWCFACLVGAVACGGAGAEAEEPADDPTTETQTSETAAAPGCDGCYAASAECRRDLNAGMTAPDCGEAPCATPSVRTVACDPSCCP